MELKSGSSLVELVVTIGLVSLLALALSAIMLTTITSSNRVRRVMQIKQAGNQTLSQIQTIIRNASGVSACDNTNNTFTTINPDGATTTIALESSRIASNSGIYVTPDNLSVGSFDITCDSETIPRLIKLNFTLTQLTSSGNNRENTTLNFETTTSLRNE